MLNKAHALLTQVHLKVVHVLIWPTHAIMNGDSEMNTFHTPHYCALRLQADDWTVLRSDMLTDITNAARILYTPVIVHQSLYISHCTSS